MYPTLLVDGARSGTFVNSYRTYGRLRVDVKKKKKGKDQLCDCDHKRDLARYSRPTSMGNCCPKGGAGASSNFQGDGRRLGTADEAAFGGGGAPGAMPIKRDEDLPKPTYDKNLDDDERAKIRAERAAAAEARAKKAGGGGTKKKKASTENKPLVGPNSQPTMRWTT